MKLLTVEDAERLLDYLQDRGDSEPEWSHEASRIAAVLKIMTENAPEEFERASLTYGEVPDDPDVEKEPALEFWSPRQIGWLHGV